MNNIEILDELILLSHELGREERQLTILGEGNTSADCGDGSFWIKASGSQLGTIDEKGFSRCSHERVTFLLSQGNLTQQQISDGLLSTLVDKTHRRPSVETFLHSICLQQPEINWVGHTHPVSVNQFLCSQMGARPFLRHLFPDEIVVCGIEPLVIPYIDPGLQLSQTIQNNLLRYQDRIGQSPKMILMENHGLIALGKTSKEVLNIQLMADKFARILWGTYALGGPNYLPQEQVDYLDNRLDEIYRRKMLAQGTS
jgi:rhamnose utilization protein RhaD (predicted bifunctional aldolase and dehydrogenase)